jgi:single-stranded DNA-binding protein
MHLNSVQVIGRVGKAGPKLSYGSSGAPSATFTLEVDEISKSGEVFVLYLPVEIWGQAEIAAETLEAGDEVMLSGRLKYKSVVDAKTQVKTSKLIVSTWGISQRPPASTSPGDVDDSASVEVACNLEAPSIPATKKATKPRVAKASRLTWTPEHAN